ncbi:MAG: TonB-dependent receptor, partial [Chitinophagaceae bacterium]
MKLISIIILLFPITVPAQFKLADIFTDNMVVQRDMPVRIWGKGIPGKKVTVKLNTELTSTSVNSDSSWLIKLKKQEAIRLPVAIIIQCENETLEIKNVLIGDIWLCLGQSNMQWPLRLEKHYQEERLAVEQPLLRFFNPTYAGQDIYGVALKPSVVDQYEIGLKNELLAGKLSANLTLYRIVNNNLAQTAPYLLDGITQNTNANIKMMSGETTSDGVEVDLAAHP